MSIIAVTVASLLASILFQLIYRYKLFNLISRYKQQIGFDILAKLKWLLPGNIVLSIILLINSIFVTKTIPDTMILGTDLLNILLLTKKIDEFWPLSKGAETKLSWLAYLSWTIIALHNLYVPVNIAPKLFTLSLFQSSIVVMKTFSGLALLATRVLLNKSHDDNEPEENPNSETLGRVDASIKKAGGFWPWIKKFSDFLPWVLPYKLPWMNLLVALSFTIKLSEIALMLYLPHLMSALIERVEVVNIPVDVTLAFLTYAIAKYAVEALFHDLRLLFWQPFVLYRDKLYKQEVFTRIAHFNATFHLGQNSASIIAACSDGTTICRIFDSILFDAIPHTVTVISAVVSISRTYEHHMVMVQLASAGLHAIIILQMNSRLERIFDAGQEIEEKTTNLRHDVLQGWITTFISNKISNETENVADGIEKETVLSQRSWNISLFLRYCHGFISLGCESISVRLLLLSLGDERGSIVGTVLAFNEYTEHLKGSLLFFCKFYGKVIKDLHKVDHLRQLLETGETTKYGNEKLRNDGGDVKFRNVSFTFPSAENAKTLFSNLDFEIQGGKVTGFVGGSGTGKTTVLNLISRIYEPTKGSILIGGQDIKTLAPGELASHIAYLQQNPYIMDNTFAFNIAYGVSNATETEIEIAGKRAGIDKMIKNRPQQYNERVGGKGVNMSGGERQRLALGRIFMQIGQGAKLLMFDEATSALDTNTEDHIKESIKTLAVDCTTIIVAHRLSTVMHADEIIVFGQTTDDRCGIVQRGTHEELINCEGKYLNMWNKHIGQEPPKNIS